MRCTMDSPSRNLVHRHCYDGRSDRTPARAPRQECLPTIRHRQFNLLWCGYQSDFDQASIGVCRNALSMRLRSIIASPGA